MSEKSPIIYFKKLHQDAKEPVRSHDTDAGYDLVAIDNGEKKWDDGGQLLYVQYRTGIAIEPPNGYHTEIFPRSSITKTGFILGNSVGLVDEGYRGELMFRFKMPLLPAENGRQYVNWDVGYELPIFTGPMYKKGDRIGQLVVRRTIIAEFIEKDELNDSVRGAGGFGSTNKG